MLLNIQLHHYLVIPDENGKFIEGVIDRKIFENIIGYRILTKVCHLMMF
jgi:hypothetical protein